MTPFLNKVTRRGSGGEVFHISFFRGHSSTPNRWCSHLGNEAFASESHFQFELHRHLIWNASFTSILGFKEKGNTAK